MAVEQTYYIMRYSTPIGDFVADEGLNIYLIDPSIPGEDTTQHLGKASSIIGIRVKVAQMIDDRKKVLIQELQNRIGEISGMAVDIDVYRKTVA